VLDEIEPARVLTDENTMKKLFGALIVLASLGIVSVAHATTVVSATFETPVNLNASIGTSGCNNSPGPTITLQGALSLGGMGVKMLFENNVIGTHTFTVESTASATVIPSGDSIQIPKQPVLGGVGGNPYIWIQFVDGNNNPLSGMTFLGRCVQGLFTDSADFAIPSTAIAQVDVADCSNTGSHITLSGQLALSGIKANILFANSVDLVHQNTQSMTVSVVLIPPGQSITFPKQPVLGGVGGNPWIFLQFTDANGNAVSDSFLLGRCVQLSQ
jgi:hypothetical protein